MNKTYLEEANLVDLSDEELKELLGYLWESNKTLEERKKSDPDLEQMRQKMKDYIKDNYSDVTKEYKGKLKAARALAAARGITWRAPDSLK